MFFTRYEYHTKILLKNQFYRFNKIYVPKSLLDKYKTKCSNVNSEVMFYELHLQSLVSSNVYNNKFYTVCL